MGKLYRIYTEALHDHFKVFYANWPVGDLIKLGDYGIMDGKIFIREGNIEKDFKIKIGKIFDKTKDTYEFQSTDSVSVTFNAKGSIVNSIPLVKASIDIEFSAEQSVFFNSAGITHETIENLAKIGSVIKKMHKEKKWPAKRVIISRLVHAENTLIAVSGGQKSILSLEADSDQIEKINLADAGIALGVKKESGIAFKIVNGTGYYPLLGIAGIKPARWYVPGEKDKWTPTMKLMLRSLDESMVKVDSNKAEYDDEFIFGDI